MILLQNVLKMSPRCICETSWRRFEAVLKTSWQDVLKMSWRRVENVLKTFWQDVLKTSWRRLENILKTSWRRMDKTNILVLTKTSWRCLEDVFWRRMINKDIFVFIKSWRCLLKTKTKDVFKKCSRRLHQDECLLGCINYMLSRVNLCRRQFMLSYAKISLLMFLWHIFSKALRESGRTLQLRFDGILLVSLKIRSSRTDLWPELRKQSDWLTSWWVIYY